MATDIEKSSSARVRSSSNWTGSRGAKWRDTATKVQYPPATPALGPYCTALKYADIDNDGAGELVCLGGNGQYGSPLSSMSSMRRP